MSKNITITNIDGFEIVDRHNLSSEQPRKKIKLIHEQLFEQYGIDPKKIYERTGMLKTLPLDWIPEIILLNIDTCKTKYQHLTTNFQDKLILIGFDTIEQCKLFYGDDKVTPSIVGSFATNMSKAINEYLTKKDLNPKHFNRIIVIESSSDGMQVTIRY
jgi:hypothetical protein